MDKISKSSLAGVTEGFVTHQTFARICACEENMRKWLKGCADSLPFAVLAKSKQILS